MAKQSGLGDALYVSGINLSGDTGSIERCAGGIAPIDVTGIDKSARERIGGLRDGGIDWTSYFNPAIGKSHPTLSALPRADALVTYCRGTSIGSPAASCVAKQINYDPKRGSDGSLTFAVAAQASAYGLEWGQLLTAGIRTDTTATNGTGLDTTASLSFGAQAYLHVFGVTGTSVTVKIQDSADNSTYADVASLTFTAATGVTSERIAIGNTATVRRYLRVATTGTFTNAQFAVVVVKNETANQQF